MSKEKSESKNVEKEQAFDPSQRLAQEAKENQAKPIEDEVLEKAASKKVSADSQRIEQLEKELAQEKNDYLKLRAEFDNFRKRTAKEKDEFAKYAAGNVVEDFLEVLDNLERAEASYVPEKTTADQLFEGFKLIQKQFDETLNKYKVEKIKAVGEPFHHDLHEALIQQPSDKPEGQVIMEIKAGYKIGDRVLRHAQVAVSSGPAEKEENKNEKKSEEGKNN